ncbi:MAG: hypothetical protein HDR55_03390 [Treponema sp.]|nr:hypothetical protein [Treponema sp.]
MKNYSKKITREQGLYIKYRLRLASSTMQAIADEVQCNLSAVCMVLTGIKHSRRIERAVAARLGYESWNEMVDHLRKEAL